MRPSSSADPPASRTRGGPTLLEVPAAGIQIEPVIATKLFVPALGSRSVERPRLRSRLEGTLRARLTVVVATAGWGKSTLVAQWLREAGVPCGWLSLDAADDDVNRFWRYLLRALHQADDSLGSAALRRLDAAGADVEHDVLPVLVNELADVDRHVVLVLDDYHLVRGPGVHRSVAALLERAPATLHLVISSRTDPPLPLSRLRVAGDLVEVRAHELGFTAEEAARLLGGSVAPEVSAEQVQRLVDRTEGWPAGLQLAALRLSDRADPRSRVDFIERFTGADRHIVGYLGEEVLDALPPRLHDFLLQTSVLPRLCAPLADAVTGGGDALHLLEEVHRGNLFLTALDDEGRWYRYHQLFRDLLLFELERSGIADQALLHRRAAEWFYEHGELGEAIGHAAASGDPDFAGDLIAQGWRSEFNLGHLQTVQSWLTALPPARVAADARLTVAQLWLYMDRGRLPEAGAALAAAGKAAVDDPHVHLLRALHTFKAGDVPLAAERLGAVHGGAADPFLGTVEDLVAGVCALWLGRLPEAADQLGRAADRAEDTGNRLGRSYALGTQALVAILTGDLASAEVILRDAETAVGDAVIGTHFVAMFPALAAARSAALRGRWDDALASATSAAELAGRGAGRVEHAAALITSAEASRHTGQDAELWLSRAAAVLRNCADPGPIVREWYRREHRAQRAGAPTVPAPAERLTERELAILALLPTALSQRQLAGSLFVSPNTMKTHVRAIYRKLGVESRDEAVLRARSLGLL
jgi:LuxR family maltose regulon positive regulatory protein